MAESKDEFFFEGIQTLGGFPHSKELENQDIVLLGVPFDNGVSHRTGAKMGPRAVRDISKLVFGFKDYMWNGIVDLEDEELKIIDYGDTGPFMGSSAVEDMVKSTYETAEKVLQSGAQLLTVGGDHTIPYGPVRAAAAEYGKLSLIHFDSHQDASNLDDQINHSTFARHLAEEGAIDPSRSVQAGLRTVEDNPGYNLIYADEMLRTEPEKIAEKIKNIVGDKPVYLSFDVDVLDPAYAPGTGTPVAGGPSTHYMRSLLRSLAGINLAAGDIVELSPLYDAGNATALAAASILQDFISLAVYNRAKRSKN